MCKLLRMRKKARRGLQIWLELLCVVIDEHNLVLAKLEVLYSKDYVCTYLVVVAFIAQLFIIYYIMILGKVVKATQI